ncbi:MAG TPA: transcriptional regulator [Janthinobacterium sp.]|nr:transcriptional regulator [Janthinobacterium sp.]
MKHTDFGSMPCPIARSLGKVGEWWSILILREAFYGKSRFDEFEKSLKIAPTILTRRLADLVAGGMLVRRQYCAKPPRYDYVLTKTGLAFKPVLLAFIAWGNEHFAPEGASLVIASRDTGVAADPVLVDAITGLPINDEYYGFAPGPAASEDMRAMILALESDAPRAPPPRRRAAAPLFPPPDFA